MLQCADARFDLDVDGSGVQSRTGAASGLLGAEFDGFSLFGESGLAGPDNLVTPFLGQVEVAANGPLSAASSFTVSQRGSVSFTPSDVAFQQGIFGSRSRVTFVPFSDSSDGPFELAFDFTHTFLLTDPANNSTRGAALGGSSAELFSQGDRRLDYSGFAELDTARDGDDVSLFLDYGDNARIMAVGQSSALVVALFDETVMAAEGEVLTLESHAFGSIFADGFEAGDTSAWASTSPTRFTVTVSSPDPSVRFRLVPEPSSCVLLLAGMFAVARWHRRLKYC